MSEAIAVALGLMAKQQESNHAAMNHRLDRFEDAVNKRFDAQDEKLLDVCDKGQREHAEFRTGIEALTDRLDAQDNQAKGRRQVIAPFVGFVREQGAGIVIGLLPFFGFGVYSALTPPAVARDAAPVSSVAQIPPPAKTPLLRGHLDEDGEAWQEPRP